MIPQEHAGGHGLESREPFNIEVSPAIFILRHSYPQHRRWETETLAELKYGLRKKRNRPIGSTLVNVFLTIVSHKTPHRILF